MRPARRRFPVCLFRCARLAPVVSTLKTTPQLWSPQSEFAERVKPAAMRITAEVVQWFQFSEDGDVDGSAESVLEIIQSGDSLAQQQGAQCIGAEGSWSHNVIVPIGAGPPDRNYNKLEHSRQPDLNVRHGRFLQTSRA